MHGASSGLRWGTALLALVVVALVLSSIYAHFRWRPTPTHGPAGRVIRVQVLNGSGEAGIGVKVASHLREGHFHVAEVGNADRFDYFSTLVVARSEDVAPAEAVARYLGGPPVIRQAWRSDLAEVTVIIGSDRSRLKLH